MHIETSFPRKYNDMRPVKTGFSILFLLYEAYQKPFPMLYYDTRHFKSRFLSCIMIRVIFAFDEVNEYKKKKKKEKKENKVLMTERNHFFFYIYTKSIRMYSSYTNTIITFSEHSVKTATAEWQIPSRHVTLRKYRVNVDATTDVALTLMRCCINVMRLLNNLVMVIVFITVQYITIF